MNNCFQFFKKQSTGFELNENYEENLKKNFEMFFKNFKEEKLNKDKVCK